MQHSGPVTGIRVHRGDVRRLISSWLISAAALWVADVLLSDLSAEHWWLYLVAAATGIGLPVAFLVMNGWLLGRDLGDMVAARHLDRAELPAWRERTRWARFATGLVASGLFVVPVVNLVAPVIGAAAMTHLFHRGRKT